MENKTNLLNPNGFCDAIINPEVNKEIALEHMNAQAEWEIKKNQKFKLLSWAMSNDEKWIDSQLIELRKNGHVVTKRRLKNNEYKFGIYYKDNSEVSAQNDS